MQGHCKQQIAVLLVLIGVPWLAACGNSDEDDIRAVIQDYTATDPNFCRHVTTGFLKLIDDSVDECEAVAKRDRGTIPLRIRGVSIDGGRARVVTKSTTGGLTAWRFVEQGDVWKVARFATLPPRTDIERAKLAGTPRAAVEGYYEAVRNEDATSLCSLLTKQYALRIQGGKGLRATPIRSCIVALENYDWSKVKRQAARVGVRRTKASGSRATVTLSNSKQAVLMREHRHWLIDAIRANPDA